MKQTKLGNRYAITALKHKRAILSGEIVQLEKQLDWKRKQLIHVDATLGIFGHNDQNAIPPVKPYTRVPLFKQGELSQAVRDALRRGGKPMFLSEVVQSVTDALGYDESAIPAMRHRVRASLEYLQRKKTAVQIGRRKGVKWSLSGT